MPLSLQARLVLGASAVLWMAGVRLCYGQQPAAQQNTPQQPVPRPASAKAAIPQQAGGKKPGAGPPAPQSTHYPILLLVQGLTTTPAAQTKPAESTVGDPVVGDEKPAEKPTGAAWSVRIGLKGPERLDRDGYPPIPLEPAEVVREGTSDAWTYHAKDLQTGAVVTVQIARGGCTDAASGTKFAFGASVDHAQIGAMQGCARVATELFPKINNQPTDEDDAAKNKSAPPTITKFKAPVAVAYNTAGGKTVFKRGTVARTLPGKDGYQLSLSHDGKRLLFVREQGVTEQGVADQGAGERTISLYEWGTGKTTELLRGPVQQPYWSGDDTRIAFLRSDGAKWQIWTMPADAPEKAGLLYPNEVVSLQGWADTRTILADDLQTLYWIGDDGAVKQTLPSADLYGKEQFGISSANTIRISPVNADLLMVSAEWLKPPQGVPVEPHSGKGMGVFLYEIRSKRRVVVCPLNMFSGYAEWSRDSLQIFFTGWGAPGGPSTIYKMFWDGTSQTKYQDGLNLVIGQ
ncbi:MAG TPA: hypothetical protein VKH15_00595 [Candidatus Acidoferrum sp.]|nr:hypothetical protein [Candidatus Acidoferrum sp.]